MKIVNFNFYKFDSDNNNEQPKYTITNMNNNELSLLDEDQKDDVTSTTANKVNEKTKNDNEYKDFPSK